MKFSIQFLSLLFMLFLSLKLTGYIGWSWWWIFSPIWLPVATVIMILGFVFLGVVWITK